MTSPEPPPFRLSRESRIRVDRDGRVWHEGERIENTRLAEGLARWIDLDPATGRWIMRNSLDWCFITVDETPLVVRGCRWEGASGEVVVDLSDGTGEPLRLDTVRVRDDGEVFAYVRKATLLARFSRAAAFAFLDRADPAGLTLVPPGATLPPRPVDAEA